MTKEKLMELGMDEATADKALAEIAKSENRLKTLEEENKNLKAQVEERDKQIKSLGDTAGDNAALKDKIAALEKSNKETAEKYAAEMKQMQINHAVDAALTKAKAKNLKAARALLSLDEFDLDDKGNVKGLDKAVAKLLEGDDSKFLFDVAEAPEGKPNVPNVAGMAPTDQTTTTTGSQSLGAQYAAAYNAQFSTPSA